MEFDVFVSCAHEDKAYVDRLVPQPKQGSLQGQPDLWENT